MNPEKVWIVIVILVLVLVLSNALVFAVVRGWSRGGSQWFGKDNKLPDFSKQEKDAQELSERMRALRESKDLNQN
jgi:alkanesulfonate monooxygenase SsuD/methylene tetrahydromethanopterin reductase-like flavin-dependent oxidoreductase (luciferase family)